MSEPIIKTSFSAGELSPSLAGRVDLAKYQVGAATMRNFFVDYRGGATTRPGTQVIGRARRGPGRPRLIPFVFNSEQAYVLELVHARMRVIYRGEYVVSEDLPASNVLYDSGQIGIVVPGTTAVIGDFIRLENFSGMTRSNGISVVNGRIFYVQNRIGDTLYLGEYGNTTAYVFVGSNGLSPWTGNGRVLKVYEIATPWGAEDLYGLNYVQSADVMTVTSVKYPAVNIKRFAHASWGAEVETYGATVPAPTTPVATPINPGTATQEFFYAYVVAAVDEDGRESPVSAVASCINRALDQTLTPTRVNQITWDAVPGAVRYRVYKAQPLPVGLQGSGPWYYGLIGSVFDIMLTDSNFAPDFTSGPLVPRNPFNPIGSNNPNCAGYLQQRKVFGGSTNFPSTLWLSRIGQYTNFDISEPVQDNDAITATLNATEVNVINGIVPAADGLIVLTSGGAYLVSGDAGGITPTSLSAKPQAFTGSQRDLQPLRIGNQLLYAQARGSAVAELAYNFYTNQFASQDVSVLSAHLLAGHRIVQWAYATEPYKVVWAVRDDGVLLSLTYLKEQEVYGWARHDTDGFIVSVATIPEGNQDAVYLNVRRDLPSTGMVYVTERMAFADGDTDTATNVPPDLETAWAVDSGAQYLADPTTEPLLTGGYVNKGALYDAVVDFGGASYTNPIIEIDDATGTGAAMQPIISGGMVTGVLLTDEGRDYTNPTLTVRDATGSGARVSVKTGTRMYFITDNLYATAEKIGMVLRVRGGRGVVTGVNFNRFDCLMDVLPVGRANTIDNVMPRVEPGDWSLSRTVSVVGGLDHLEGAVVQVLADGAVQTPKRVDQGSITLDRPASIVTAGLGFTAQLQTMRLEAGGGTLQGTLKAITKVVVRTKNTRGLFVGSSWDTLYEIKQRENEQWGQTIRTEDGGTRMQPLFENAPSAYAPFQYKDQEVMTTSDYTKEGVVCIQQSYPLPASILAVIPFIAPGGDVR